VVGIGGLLAGLGFLAFCFRHIVLLLTQGR
jgi:hypothetical protein